MNTVRKHKSDRIIGALTVVLLCIGLIVIYAIGPMRAVTGVQTCALPI